MMTMDPTTAPMAQRPSIGRIVHYYYGAVLEMGSQERLSHPKHSHDGPFAAIIVDILDDKGLVELEVLWPTRVLVRFFSNTKPRPERVIAAYSETDKDFHWSWPPRVG